MCRAVAAIALNLRLQGGSIGWQELHPADAGHCLRSQLRRFTMLINSRIHNGSLPLASVQPR